MAPCRPGGLDMSTAGTDRRGVDTPTLRQVLRFGAKTLQLVWGTNRRLTAAVGIITLAVALLPALATYLSKLIVDGVLDAVASGLPADRTAVIMWVAAEAVVLTSLLGSRRVLRLTKSLLHAELGYGVSRAILDKSLALELHQLEDPAIQQKILLARQHATSRPFGLVNRLFEQLQYSLTLVAFGALLWTFSPLAVLLVIVGGLPLFVGEVRFSGRVFRFYTGRTPEMRERSYLESLMTSDAAAVERLHYGAGPEIRRRYTALFGKLYDEDRRLQTRRAGAALGLSTLSSVVFFATKAWIVWEAMLAAITLGQMTMFVGLVKQGQGAVTSLLTSAGGMYEDLLYVSNLYEFLEIPESRRPGTSTQGTGPGDGIRLEGVSFTYPAGSRPALDDVTLHIAPGSSIGIVGANGSGKTTLVRLVAGLYRPDSGRILLDGLDIEQWDRGALRARMAVMFQPFTRYKMTAGENVAMGDGLRDSDESRLWRAAEHGLAADLIRELPAGLGTRLSRRFLDGRELSGGQWQRLALARTFMREGSDILILDEPTSAMDAAAEAELMAATRKASPAQTTILISHRLANLRQADRILVLEQGRVVEQGSHDELVDSRGAYQRLFALQAEPYQ